MKASRSLLISCLLALAFGHCAAAVHVPRQTPASGTTPSATPPPSITPSVPPPKDTTAPPPSPSASDTGPAPPPSDTTTKPTSTEPPPPSDTSKPNPETPTSLPPTNTPPPPPPPPTTVVSTSTDAQGAEITITETHTPSLTSSTESATSTDKKSEESSGLGVGPIIGMSVAGGIAVIGIIGFFVWKFTRKRNNDFDDGEAIKWPELNTHGGNPDSHPLPVHNTGRSGFDTGSEASLSRVPSSSNYSTPDVGNVGPDPYAVPPLPHLNPNQPYRDDPTAATGYYDPYRGPIPGTLEHGAAAGEWGGEAIPMTQMAGNAGRMSPGPQMYDVGRKSPGPQAAYGGDPMYDVGRRSPGPQAAYAAAGRTASPGPQAVYGGRASPGSQAAYGGRMSPGPHAAYDYGARQ